MSWFSDIASKAEAILVRLDQDAAQALHDPDGILRGTRIIDQAINTISGANSTSDNADAEPLVPDEPETRSHVNFGQINNFNTDLETDNRNQSEPTAHNDSSINVVDKTTSQQSYQEHIQTPIENLSETKPEEIKNTIINQDDSHSEESTAPHVRLIEPTTSSQIVGQINKVETRHQMRKFKLQTSKLQRPISGKKSHNTSSLASNSRYPSANGVMESRIIDPALTSPGADDIRASINKSLQDYSLSSSVNINQESIGTPYSSHFDNQPNLVQVSPSTEHSYSNDILTGRGRNSNSFSIELPNGYPLNSNNPTSDIASRLIKQASRRKSTFSIHQVINRLAYQNGQSNPLIGESTKLKFRRAQMRAASYARRLNYYFRAYPTMKYWLIAYIFIMQLLVVYVLFFYQSNTSYSYLSAQVKQQQDVLKDRNNQ